MSLGIDYWRLFISSALSNVGDGIRMAALPLLALTRTTEPLQIAAVAAAPSRSSPLSW